METPQKHDDIPTQWFCVLDPQMRQIYLGRDERLARRYWTTGCAIGRADRMGDAIRLAATAAASAHRPNR
jgi:hypothetical protein